MYKLENNRVIKSKSTEKVNGKFIGNFDIYLSRLPIAERQGLGWFANKQSVIGLKSPYTDPATDTIYIIGYEAPTTFEISKYKLLLALDEVNLLNSFSSFLDENEKIKLLWDAATVLDSNNPFLLDVIAVLKADSGITDAQITSILEASAL